MLGTGRSDKNDPNDARSVAIAALRSPGLRSVHTADHAEVLRLVGQTQPRHRRPANQARVPSSCRDLPPSPRAEYPRNSTLLTPMACSEPSSRRPRWSTTRYELALELLDDVRRLDCPTEGVPQADRDRRPGVGNLGHRRLWGRPVLACSLIGYTGDVTRFSEPRPVRRLQRHRTHRAVFGWSSRPSTVSAWQPPAQPRHPHGGHLPDPPDPLRGPCLLREKVAEGKTKKEAVRSLKRQISQHRLPASRPRRPAIRAREDKRERLFSQRDRLCTLTAGSSVKSLPDPPNLRHSLQSATAAHRVPESPENGLLTQRGFDRGTGNLPPARSSLRTSSSSDDEAKREFQTSVTSRYEALQGLRRYRYRLWTARSGVGEWRGQVRMTPSSVALTDRHPASYQKVVVIFRVKWRA